jgi:hypothetical protein
MHPLPDSNLTTHASRERLIAVRTMAAHLRVLFEVERELLRVVSTLIYRVGEPELKYTLCQHIWEAAQHARFLRERGRELSGFGNDEKVRPTIRRILEEAIVQPDPMHALAGIYRVIKPGLAGAYRHYLVITEPLADWPSRKLVEEFLKDEERHCRELSAWLTTVDAQESEAHIGDALGELGGWLGQTGSKPLPSAYSWQSVENPYRHPAQSNRGKYPCCSSVFGDDPAQFPVVRPWLTDPKTDPRVIRLMVYVWLLNEMDAVDYLATFFWDTPDYPFDLHYDLVRHLWDESRHSAFGFRQLPKLGVDPLTVEHAMDLYSVLVTMEPAERYAMMTMEFESGSFPTKAVVMDRVRELNDFEADTLLAFDRNDEQNHVRYGHRWLPELLRLRGDLRSVDQFVADTRARFAGLAQIHAGTTPHTLPAAQRLTGVSILRLAGS